MSEYQHYAFRAIDHRLTAEQQKQVRAYSSRATITATSFENVYNWSNFRGNPKHFLTEFFDVYAYWANWSSRTLGLRLPSGVLDLETARLYVNQEYYQGVEITEVDSGVILMFQAHVEDFYDDIEYERDWLGELVAIREELIRGDLRSLYLAWLAGANQTYSHDGDEEGYDEPGVDEPPVPWGLSVLTTAQHSLAEFLYLDQDALEAAAEASKDQPSVGADPMAGFKNWIASLPDGTKTEALLRVVEGQAAAVATDLLQRYRATDTFQSARRTFANAQDAHRTVADLFALIRKRRRERKEHEASEKARRIAEREERERLKREAYLRSRIGDEEELWKLAEASISKRNEQGYRQAIAKLLDLRDLYAMQDNMSVFEVKMATLANTHERKRNFVAKARKAGLVE
ncbi:MAG: hypothetical protein AAFS10_02000 [Myxococcota bacterium]